MRKRIKRLIRGLLKLGSVFILIGFGVIIGLIIGVNTADRGETIIIRGDFPGVVSHELAPLIEQRVAQEVMQQVETRIQEQLEFSPIPTIPPIPEIPPHAVYIDHSPSFLEVINGIGTILASLGLIGLGTLMIARGRRAPEEKSPESLNG